MANILENCEASYEADLYSRTSMTKSRQHLRYKVEFPATFAGDHAWMAIVYNLGIGGCKMVSHRKVKCGDLLSVHLNVPEQTTPISILAAKVQWMLEHGFGVEFLEIQKVQRARLEQFLDAQVHIAT